MDEKFKNWATGLGYGINQFAADQSVSVLDQQFQDLCTPQLVPVWEWVIDNVKSKSEVGRVGISAEDEAVLAQRKEALERRVALRKKLDSLKLEQQELSKKLKDVDDSICRDKRETNDLEGRRQILQSYRTFIETNVDKFPIKEGDVRVKTYRNANFRYSHHSLELRDVNAILILEANINHGAICARLA
jgi:HAUS augmin-like complex subunit 5